MRKLQHRLCSTLHIFGNGRGGKHVFRIQQHRLYKLRHTICKVRHSIQNLWHLILRTMRKCRHNRGKEQCKATWPYRHDLYSVWHKFRSLPYIAGRHQYILVSFSFLLTVMASRVVGINKGMSYPFKECYKKKFKYCIIRTSLHELRYLAKMLEMIPTSLVDSWIEKQNGAMQMICARNTAQ